MVIVTILLGCLGVGGLVFGGFRVIESRRDSGVEKLGEMNNLTFKRGQRVADWNNGCSNCQPNYFRQLECFPLGTAGCGFHRKLSQVTCFNKGIMDGKVKWRCSAPRVITFPYRFGETDVWCGLHHPKYANNPDLYVRHERSCGLVYTVDYIVNPLVFVGIICLVVGGLLMYWIHKKYLKSTSEVTSQVKNPEDIVFNEDPFNKWIWGTSGVSRRVRGPHSIGVAPAAAAPAQAQQEDGGLGDGVPPARKANKVVIDEEDDDGRALHRTGSSLIRLSSRTSSGTSASSSPRSSVVSSHSRGSFAHGSASRH